MKIGINLPQTTSYDLAADVTVFAKAAEGLGFDSLWAYDRLLTPEDQSGRHGLYGMADVPWPERYGYTTDPLITLALAAAVTERVELGTGILVAPLYGPVRLAKSLAALDAASGGRVIAGLGAGWSVDEFEAAAPRPIGERGAALDEFLDVAAAVWGPDPVSFDNGRYRVSPSRFNPKPVRRIPIVLGGRGEAALERIARRADGWLPTGMPAAAVQETLTRLRQMAEKRGRDPYEINCVFQVGITDLGELGRVVDDLGALERAGVGHAYVTLPSAAANVAELLEAAGELSARLRGR
ncbi:TIGR03619 family F420-dependent LLM class oxidoreductase [Actinoplanes sp. Pm04-4]|uniref:TIGR03619 family F420-dependent LLM class oxidoreductase n=1 Tax=Paractinoplanes pyxinae TaxID=2997416 RepID=A0ABT4BCS6_9ACTN|nr:TIGR03619 family F420-dependent LLM class oxidoreductase [Actinoplanes pyxinae]MCY1144322.1 TIGR03619 family F420-dependent LLM class oxidoreductase [Actinoplanes pyxinae]